MFSDVEGFTVRLFWTVVTVFVALIVGNLVLGWIKSRGGLLGGFAGNIEAMADPD